MAQPAGSSKRQAPRRNLDIAAPTARLAEEVTTALHQQSQAAAVAPASGDRTDLLQVKSDPKLPFLPARYWCFIAFKGLCLQVMHDVTGCFISNTMLQLKTRAASLCLQELEEYKVTLSMVKLALASCLAYT